MACMRVQSNACVCVQVSQGEKILPGFMPFYVWDFERRSPFSFATYMTTHDSVWRLRAETYRSRYTTRYGPDGRGRLRDTRPFALGVG